MQDLIRIRVADATQYARIGQRPLQRAVFGRKRVSKGVEIARENLDSSRVDRTQTLLASENMQRCAVLCARFRKRKRAADKIKGCQTLAACQLCSSGLPVQPAGNHQVQHQPEVAFDSNRDSLADSPQLAYDASLHNRNGRLCSSQQKRTSQSHS